MTASLVLSALLIAVGQSPSVTSGKLADAASHREAVAEFRAGQELLSAEKFEEAAARFTKAVEKDPLLSIAHYGLGQAYMNLPRFARTAKRHAPALEAKRPLPPLQQTNQLRGE